MTEDEVTGAEVEAQTQVLAGVAGDLARDRTERKRATRLTASAGTLAFVLAIVDLLGVGILLVNAHTLTQNSREVRNGNRNIQKVLTVVDPHSPAGKASAKAFAKAVELILVEVDCRNRRAIVHLAQPRPGTLCVLPPNN